MLHVQSVSVLYEYGVPSVKFHYINGEARTLTDEQAVRFVDLVENERQRQDIDVTNMSHIRKSVADQHFR